MEQHELPGLPPMSSPVPAKEMALPQTISGDAHRKSNTLPMAGGKRLRQMLAVIAGGGIGMVALVGFGEVVLRPELKPTTILATFEAQPDLKGMNQKLGVAPGTVEFTEDQYREKIAEAERRGQAKAEVEFQKEIAVVQADKERVVGAYQTLYQRANIIAQAALQLESVAQQFRQRLLETTNGGRSIVISIKDMICALGESEACDSARNDRASMIAEADQLSRGDVGKRVKELMADVPDPASLVVNDDRRRHGTPHIDH